VKDRVVQTALVLLLQPILEADFNENSFGHPFTPTPAVPTSIAAVEVITGSPHEVGGWGM
jgi:hypothetical protein